MGREFSELMSRMEPERRFRIEARVQAALAEIPLQELRKARELPQVQLAQALETSQSEVSKIERRADLCVSTLRSYHRGNGRPTGTSRPFP